MILHIFAKQRRRLLLAVLCWFSASSLPGILEAAVATGDSTEGSAGTWNMAGSLDLELRWFPRNPAHAGQLEEEQSSVAVTPEWHWRSADRRHQLDFTLFGRFDDQDDRRSHVDVREASYRYLGDSFELLAGVSRVFWGVTESRHLVDVINQTDAVEDIDEEDKLGQPMLQLAFERDWGRVEIFSLLDFRERTFPSTEGRLRPPLPVSRQATFDSGAVAWAVRWSHFLGDWDVAAHLFHGTGREPRLILASDGRSLIPLYELTNQAGVEAQYTRGAWLFKLEALAREGQGATFGAAVAGFEYTRYQLGSSSADLGLLLELLWDDRDVTAPPTIHDEDLFLGARLAVNDIQDTQLLAGALIDIEDHSIVAILEASRRLGNRITTELEARIFSQVDPTGDLAALSRDSFVTLRLAWHW